MHPLHIEDNLLYPVYQFRFILIQIHLHTHMHSGLADQEFKHSMANLAFTESVYIIWLATTN